tara:strand:- start:708 stop:1427 length:720 start_codon:yes stop_codon:yes gene_type:complete
MNKLNEEIESFKNIWHGGFRSGYDEKRGQKRLEDYLEKNLEGASLLEIGCGGGQWSKYIYDLNVFKKIYCVDVLSAEHNNFWEYVGEESKNLIEYFQVNSFDLLEIPDNSIDYLFSYDVFCHISYSGISNYLESLSSKCKKNAKLLIMYADPKKYLKSEPENRYHLIRYLPKKKFIYRISNNALINDAILDCDGAPSEGRWYWVGKEKFLDLADLNGFEIIKEDINTDNTNPITLLKKK